ncbi:MAG: GAF domain-containing protein [Pseudolabrys sp.]
MRPRSKTGGKAIKTQRRKTLASKATPGSRSPAAGKETHVARLTHERDEALEQLAATSEVLQVISSSPGKLEPVFQAMLANAVRICEAKFGTLYRIEGDSVRCVAMHGVPKAFAEERCRVPVIRPAPTTTLARALATKRPVQIADVRDYPDAPSGYTSGALAKLAGARTILTVPMLKDDKLVGAIVIYRQEVRPFTDKQIELVKNFAAQAIIAIENTRLLNELRESLQQQTATADVLKVISRSTFDLQTVLDTLVESAARLCGAEMANIWRPRDGAYRLTASYGVTARYKESLENKEFLNTIAIEPGRGTTVGRVLLERKSVHIHDIQADPDYKLSGLVALGGTRTMLGIPMLREGDPIGVLVLVQSAVRPFTDKQIELATTFADQAVIAIENVRLFEEVQARTRDLSESLEQQTATSEVLQVISSSAGELKPVFETMLESAVRICGAKFGNLLLVEGDAFRHVALHGAPQAYLEERRREPVIRPRPGSDLDRIRSTKQIVHVADMQLEGPATPAIIELAGARTLLNVPMLKDNELIGTIGIYRQEVHPFTDKQIELVQNFAAQAVIAIENARLLNDLNRLNQQLEQRVADQVSEIERMGKLRRFLPPQVADLIVASGSEKQLESHRREITALFCDLRGFTGFSESSDPEDVMALLRDYHAAIGGIINKYGGTLERYAGDGVMVVFNDPIPVDNPALQAVLMAIDMRGAIGDMIEKRRKLGHDIGFGIGIAHGFATLGTIGFEGRFDYAAIGTVSNVASRLCDEAKPGQILISPRVLMAVEGAISVEPVGEFKLKGISRPLAAYNVLSAVSAKI